MTTEKNDTRKQEQPAKPQSEDQQKGKNADNDATKARQTSDPVDHRESGTGRAAPSKQ